jgi:hypothetical protein
VSPPPGRLNAFLGLPRTEPVVLQGHVGGVLALEVLRKRRGKEGAVLVLSGGEDKQVCLCVLVLCNIKFCTVSSFCSHNNLLRSMLTAYDHLRLRVRSL